MKAPLSNFDFIDYYKNNSAFGGVFSRDNIPKLKDHYYIVNLDGQRGSGTHWVVIYNVGRSVIYLDSFGVSPPDEVLEELRQTRKQKLMNTYRIQDLKSVNCGFFCIYVIDELLRGWEYIDILSDFDPKDYEKNDKFIEEIF